MLPDKRILKLARELDPHALAGIYDRYSPALYRYAMRQLGDPMQAEDCVAETFSRFLQALHKGGGPNDHLQAYLYRIAHNWITDHYRSQTPVVENIEQDLLPAEDHNTQQAGEQNIIQDHVRKALHQLTPDQRQVIMLKYLEGWSNQEVARILDKPVGAVKALQHRAINALQRILVEASESNEQS
ncbi:MAG: sigma-70 family RNA polymerase sigma factor [Anaerolineales bacterium]|nr:sigma-70 family RNA polymerase sigma factor [Anaerolineales bacterium]